MAIRKQLLKDKLSNAGLLQIEIRQLMKGYKPSQFRTISYLQNIVKARRLYVSNLRDKGLTSQQIKDRIKILYVKKGWTNEDGLDIWKMIRAYRKKAIEDGDYFPVKRKGSHHGEGVSKGDIRGQKERSRHTSVQQKINNLNAQIENTDDPKTKAWLIGLRDDLKKGK